MTPTCSTCRHYHQFRAGDHIIGSHDLDAGDCHHPWMGLAYRTAGDRPVFGDCWEKKHD